MARTPAQKAKLEKDALANENKSEGMRDLLKAGYEVAEIKDLFRAPYGFVYGVGVRAGLITPEPREAKPKTAKAKTAAKAPAKAAAKTPARAAKAPAKKTTAKKATAKA